MLLGPETVRRLASAVLLLLSALVSVVGLPGELVDCADAAVAASDPRCTPDAPTPPLPVFGNDGAQGASGPLQPRTSPGPRTQALPTTVAQPVGERAARSRATSGSRSEGPPSRRRHGRTRPVGACPTSSPCRRCAAG